MAEDVELGVALDDELTGPAHAEARALQQLQAQLQGMQRAAQAASAAERQLASSMRAAGMQRNTSGNFTARGGGAIKKNDLFDAAFAGDIMSDGLRTLTGGGVLSSIGSTIGTALGGPIGAAIGGAAGGALDMIISAAQRAAMAVYQLGRSFFQAVAGAAVLRDRAVSAFEALRGKGQGLQGFQDVMRISKEMGSSVATTFDGIRALMAAGFKAPDAERWFKRMQDLSAIGIDEQTQGRVVLAMSQIKGAGVLQGDELRQLQETGLNIDLIWQSIAKQLGVTTKEAKKLKEQGKVSADVALAAIEDAVRQMTGGGGAGEARQKYLDKTFGGALQQLKSGGELWLMSVAEKAAPSFERLSGTVKKMTKYLESAEGAAWIERAAAYIDAMVAGLELAGGLIVAFAQGMGLIDSTATTKNLAESLRELGKNKDIFDAMAAAGAATAAAINGIVFHVRLLIDALNMLWPLLSGLSGFNIVQMGYQLASGESSASPGVNGGGGILGGLPFFGNALTPALAGGQQGPGHAIRAPQPSDFAGGPQTGWLGAEGSNTTNNQNNSFAISVQGGGDAGDLAAKIASEVKRQLALVSAQLGV